MRWVVKTSAVRVADSQGDRVYPSLEEMPEELRRKVKACIAGERSQTVLIANPEAYERILKGVPDLPSEMRRFQPALLRQRRARDPETQQWKAVLIGGFGVIVLLWGLWIWSIRTGL